MFTNLYLEARMLGQPADVAFRTAKLANTTGVAVRSLVKLLGKRQRPASFKSAREVRAIRKADREYCRAHDC